MIDKKLEISTYTEVGRQKQEPRAATPSEFEFGARIKTVQGMGDEVGKLYSGDLRTRETVLAGFNLDDKVDNMYYEESGDGKNVSIKGYLTNGKPINIPYIKNGEKVTVYEFANAFAQAIGRKDLVFENDAVWKQALKKHEKYSEDWGINRKDTRNTTYWTPQAPKKKEEAAKAVDVGFTPFGLGDAAAASALNKIVSKYGFTVKPTVYGGNAVAIYDAAGNKLSGNIYTNYGNQADQKKRQDEFNNALNELIKGQGGNGELD
jgi:hypothetical protein